MEKLFYNSGGTNPSKKIGKIPEQTLHQRKFMIYISPRKGAHHLQSLGTQIRPMRSTVTGMTEIGLDQATAKLVGAQSGSPTLENSSIIHTRPPYDLTLSCLVCAQEK